MRKFETGATRNADNDKLDFEGFLSPLVLKRYAKYMHSHRRQTDGSLRDSDNWQRGIPADVYVKSAFRHFLDLWSEHRGINTAEGFEDNACALIFNVMGLLHERLKAELDVNSDETAPMSRDIDYGFLRAEAIRLADEIPAAERIHVRA